MKPVLGITCGYRSSEGLYYLREGYWEAVHKAGGIPIILPPLTSGDIRYYFDRCDGFILSGGDDIDPAYWGEDPLPGLGEIDPRRDKFEIELTVQVVAGDKPALFICRGIQVLNVALGGDLIQNLKSTIAHRQKAPRNHPFHDILVNRDSNLYNIFQQDVVRVNSFHHQAINRLAPGLRVTARTRDGVIEGVEHTARRWILGVQWHPEAMNDPWSDMLFAGLVEACGPRG
ncbi:MAG: gamma-glutamyl-gamma-aminobutyrate hydrolase family protein [Syntrophomonadaceae bacterium]|nr:gamma-glutamyl-gamma-aminobutyrate hydrolase family protein [Syntrophomonadaceae bacterium]